MKTFKFLAIPLAILGAVFLFVRPVALADETAGTAVKNSAEDVKASTKKGVRKMKRQGRKAAGTDNVGKDAKDKVNDAGDDLQKNANKAKNNANN